MTTEEKLDLLLDSLRKEEFSFVGQQGALRSTLPFQLNYKEKTGEEITVQDIGLWMRKLEKDEFVSKKSGSNGNTFEITIDGLIFEGYAQRKINRTRKETRINRNEMLLRNYTLVLAFGTVALVVVETIVHWNEICHFFSDKY